MLTGWFSENFTFFIVVYNMICSNAAVCGAMLGCKLGFKALPEDLLKFHHRDWLDKKVDSFLKTVGLV